MTYYTKSKHMSYISLSPWSLKTQHSKWDSARWNYFTEEEEISYLMTHSTHFIYGYMIDDPSHHEQMILPQSYISLKKSTLIKQYIYMRVFRTHHSNVTKQSRTVWVDTQSLSEVNLGETELLLFVVNQSYSIPERVKPQ